MKLILSEEKQLGRRKRSLRKRQAVTGLGIGNQVGFRVKADFASGSAVKDL